MRNGVEGTARLKPFTVVDDRISLLIIAGDYAVTIGIILAAIAIHHPLATIIAIPLIAGRQVAFLNIVHAAGHYSLFSKRKTNDRVDFLIAYLILDGVRPYRSNHLPHHRLFNRKDPERFAYLEERLLRPDDSTLRRTWRVIVKPFLGIDGFSFLSGTFEQAVENPWWTARLAIYWTVVVAFFWWAGWLGYLALYWFLPLLWVYPVLYNWAELTDHFAVRYDARLQRGLFYSMFLKGHEMYHAVHHVHPRIPFYRIKAASEHLKACGEEFEETRGLSGFLKILYSRLPADAGATSVASGLAEVTG
jgi:fatty acid desaturase